MPQCSSKGAKKDDIKREKGAGNRAQEATP